MAQIIISLKQYVNAESVIALCYLRDNIFKLVRAKC